MTDDTPTSKAPPSEPTTAPAPTRPEGENADAAIAMVGRPTPSPDQFLPQTASSAKSDDYSSPNASGDVEIDGQPSIGYTPDGKEDATSPGYATTTREDNADSFISTPSPFKDQVAALAGVKEGTCEKRKPSFDASDNEGQEYTDLPPPPGQISTPAAFSMSNYRRDRLLSEALIHSPDPLLDDANVNDYELLDREVMAAASTASAMLSRSDGFDPMPAFPGIGRNGGSGMYDGGTMTATRCGGLDMRQFFMYPTQDSFPLPSILQAHLDETYAASTLVLEQIRNDDREGTGGATANTGQVFFQVTAYRPRGGGGDMSAPGTTPPAVAFRSASSPRYREGGTDIDFDSDNVGRGKTLEQLSHLPNQSAASHNSKKMTNATTRPRPLPLRKRKLKVYADSDDEEYKAPEKVVVAVLPADNKRILVRHNMRSDNERITCKCMKSQCLKLYCDCFQQSLLCTSSCECKNCKNREAHAGPGGVRTKAIQEIMKRRPDAFQPRTRDADEGCRCKKNKCLKKYCICFNQNVKCDSRCRCKDCGNQPTMEDDMKENPFRIKIKVQPTAQYMVPPKVKNNEAMSPVPISAVSSDESIYLDPPALPVEFTYGCCLESPSAQLRAQV